LAREIVTRNPDVIVTGTNPVVITFMAATARASRSTVRLSCGEAMHCGRPHRCVWRGIIICAARSAMTIVGAFVLPLVIVGMIDASATRRFVVP
jgi:hypothetical protein